jgi:hypothetical protein
MQQAPLPPPAFLIAVLLCQYLNIREYDLEETNLLRYWDKTYNFIKVSFIQIAFTS